MATLNLYRIVISLLIHSIELAYATEGWTGWYGDTSSTGPSYCLISKSNDDLFITKVCVRYETYITEIQGFWSDGSGHDICYGGSNNFACYEVDDGECFNEVGVRHDRYVDGMQFHTSNGKKSDWWGGNGGNYNSIGDGTTCLTKINTYEKDYIDAVEFYFAPMPTHAPTSNPTDSTKDPTEDPTKDPTKDPTFLPTMIPTSNPTFLPSIIPTMLPSFNPTELPSSGPTFTRDPSTDPTISPTSNPSSSPTPTPTDQGEVNEFVTTNDDDKFDNKSEGNSAENNSALSQDIVLIIILSGLIMVICFLCFMVKRFRKKNNKQIMMVKKSTEIEKENIGTKTEGNMNTTIQMQKIEKIQSRESSKDDIDDYDDMYKQKDDQVTDIGTSPNGNDYEQTTVGFVNESDSELSKDALYDKGTKQTTKGASNNETESHSSNDSIDDHQTKDYVA